MGHRASLLKNIKSFFPNWEESKERNDCKGNKTQQEILEASNSGDYTIVCIVVLLFQVTNYNQRQVSLDFDPHNKYPYIQYPFLKSVVFFVVFT
jgi:hypothetical protein